MTRFVWWLVPLLCSCGSASTVPTTRGAGAGASRIAWESWSAEAFERAADENRMVLVDVGIEGCTACRWMYEDTYEDARVIERVNRHFVAVTVDADINPDVGERYARWGWPAIIVLTGDGTQVHAIRGNRRPRNFVPILDELIERHQNGALERDSNTPIAAGAPDDGPLARLCADAIARVDAVTNTDHGGYGPGFRGAQGAPIRWELARAHNRGEDARGAHALQTLAGFEAMIDPVWGGIFVAARNPDFTGPIPEKRTIHQAPVMAAYAEAYHLSGDERWLRGALATERYLREWMLADDGTFYATQEDVAPGLPSGMDANAYYEIDGDAERRRFGIPPIDHAVYTDLNALAIEAYVRLFEATGDATHLEVAVRAATALLATRTLPSGAIRQTAPTDRVATDDRMRVFVARDTTFLEPQGPFGLALLALYSATGDERWRDAALGIAAGLATLRDGERGGFYASDAPSPVSQLARRRPYRDNLQAARFMARLGWVTRDSEHTRVAERTLRAVSPRERLARMGASAHAIANAIDELVAGSVDFTVIGNREDPRARALFEAAVRLYEPRKNVHFEAAGVRYPDQGQPAMFICTSTACSSPILEPEQVAEIAASQARVDPGAACSVPR